MNSWYFACQFLRKRYTIPVGSRVIVMKISDQKETLTGKLQLAKLRILPSSK